jgi:hypothetical protein
MKQPFARFQSIMLVLRNLIAQGVPLIDAQVKAGADRYQSRGKGKSRSKISPRFVRAYRSKYQPHIGAKEQAKWAAKHAS